MRKIIFVFLFFLDALSGFSQAFLNDSSENVFFNQKVPLIVGHRGGFDSKLPENSIALFDFTYENACSKPIGIEFDIRESASGSLFLMHDSTVDRTTNGTGKIALLSDSYIKTLFLRDSNGNLTTEKIPLFSEVLSHFRGKNIILMLDVKGKIFSKVISMVEKSKLESKCIILTFHQNNTKLVKETTGKILISALVINENDWESELKLQIPSWQLIAYVNAANSLELINEICKSKVLVMTDMNEGIRNHSTRYVPEYYRHFSDEKHLGILITDYPLFVNTVFCK